MITSRTRDPLQVLRAYDPPVAPHPDFSAQLRRRLESAVTTASPRPAALPCLTVADARAAIAWYVEALGAVMVGDPIILSDNRIGRAELALADGVLHLADEDPDTGLTAPSPGAASVTLMLAVPDVDAALRRARGHGARVHREPADDHGVRTATLIDPFGHRWLLTAL